MYKFTKIVKMLKANDIESYWIQSGTMQIKTTKYCFYMEKVANGISVKVRYQETTTYFVNMVVKNQNSALDLIQGYIADSLEYDMNQLLKELDQPTTQAEKLAFAKMDWIMQETQEEQLQSEVIPCETIETVDIETYHDITTNEIYALNPYNDNDDDKIKVYTIQGDTLTYSHTISLYHMESFFEYVDTFKINADDIYIIETQETSCNYGKDSVEMWAEKDAINDEMVSLIDSETGKIIAQTTKEEYKKRLSFLERWDKNNYLYNYSGYCDGIKKEYEQLKNMSYLMFESDLSVLPNTYDEKISYFNRAKKVCDDNVTRLIINCKNLHDIIDDYMENIYYKKACQNIIDDIDDLKHTYNMH